MKRIDPARGKFVRLASAYVDGEVTADERRWVEQYAMSDATARAELAALEATSRLVGTALRASADEVDWQVFTRQVMSHLHQEPLGLGDRLRVVLGRLLGSGRAPVAAAAAAALVAVALAVPITLRTAAPQGYAASKLEIQTVSVDAPSQVRPVVMRTERGDAVIWTVQEPEKADAGGHRATPPAPAEDHPPRPENEL
jgi:anti-sigma factor RsiW